MNTIEIIACIVACVCSGSLGFIAGVGVSSKIYTTTEEMRQLKEKK